MHRISRNKQATPNSRPGEGIFSNGETTIVNLIFFPNLSHKRLTEFFKNFILRIKIFNAHGSNFFRILKIFGENLTYQLRYFGID
jgi:hypothetical protein